LLKMRVMIRLVVVLLGVVAVAAYGFLAGWHIEKVPLSEHMARMESFVEFHTAGLLDAAETAPAVILFHGCGGAFTHQAQWAEYFNTLGYVAVVVDSLAARHGVSKKRVCAGTQLLGRERAGDVLAAIAIAKQRPFIDSDSIYLAGWSHGAWSIMDAVAQVNAGRKPSNIRGHVPREAVDVAGTLLFYPYCGVFAQAARYGFEQSNSLMILASDDRTIPSEGCEDLARDYGLRYELIADADHAFDYPPGLEQYGIVHNAQATAQARALVKAFLLPSRSRW